MFCCFIFNCFSNLFNKILESWRAWTIFIISFLYLKLWKLLFQNHVFSFESLYHLLKQQLLFLIELKYFFANKTATFINEPANLLNNEPKNHPGWFILNIWALDNLISVDILLSFVFLNLVDCLVVNNNSWGKLFLLNILMFILKVAPVWFLTAVFSLFSCEFDNLTFTLLYTTIYIFLQSFCCSFVKL